jgi:hypothetical protein
MQRKCNLSSPNMPRQPPLLLVAARPPMARHQRQLVKRNPFRVKTVTLPSSQPHLHSSRNKYLCHTVFLLRAQLRTVTCIRCNHVALVILRSLLEALSKCR